MYLAALDPMSLVRALPGNVAQGIIWGIMATWRLYHLPHSGFCGSDG